MRKRDYMKITIDTKEDSHEEIRKIIKMLSSLVGEETFTNQGNIFEDQNSDLGNQNIFGVFDDKNQNTTSENQTSEDPKEQEKETDDVDIDIPGVEEYH